MNFWNKITERTAINSVQHLNAVRIDIEQTPVAVTTQGYGVLVISYETPIGLQRRVKFVSPEKTIHVLYLTKGSSANLSLMSPWGYQKVNFEVRGENLDLHFTHPKMLGSFPFALGLRGEPDYGKEHSHCLHADKMRVHLTALKLRQNLIKNFRIQCLNVAAKRMTSFRVRVPNLHAQVGIHSVRNKIAIPTFQEHLKRQNFDFKFMSLMTKKEVS